MDWNKLGAIGSLVGGICAAVTLGATVWPWPQIRALRAKQSDPPKPTLYSPPKLKLFGGLLALSFLLSTVSIYNVWHADYDIPLDQMEHVRHRNFLNETVEIDGRDFEDCTFTNVKLMTHGKKSSAFHHGTFYGTVALTTDNDALSAFGEAMWSLGMTSYDGVGEDAKKNFWISRRYVGPGRLPEKFPAAPPTEPLQK